MTDSLCIRPCEAEDITAITAIYHDAVIQGTATFELVPPTTQEMMERWEQILADGFPYLVAAREKEIVGYAYAASYRARPAYRHTIENSVYVHSNHHHQGIGNALLSALIEESTRRGFRQMVAIIGGSSHTASIRLHESAGFIPVGVLRSVGWKHGRWLDTVIMQRPLGNSDSTAPSP